MDLPDGDPNLGRRIFDNHCSYCHSIDGGETAHPPILGRVVNKPAGKMTKYPYTEALKKSKIIWTRENLFQFLGNPRKFIPGTRMYS